MKNTTRGPDSSPDLLNNVKIGQDQLWLKKKYFVLQGLRPFWTSDLKQSNEYSIKSNSPVISEEKMFR